jgi:hypothetical protein
MKKTMLVLCAAGAMMLVGCAKGHRGGAEMGAVSGECQKADCCKKDGACSKDKASMGAVSGEKKDCASKCSSDKASMGAVSGSSCSEKKDCASKCTAK